MNPFCLTSFSMVPKFLLGAYASTLFSLTFFPFLLKIFYKQSYYTLIIKIIF